MAGLNLPATKGIHKLNFNEKIELVEIAVSWNIIFCIKHPHTNFPTHAATCRKSSEADIGCFQRQRSVLPLLILFDEILQ